MLREADSSGYLTTPRRSDLKSAPFLSERKWALFGIFLSLAVILSKITYNHGDALKKTLVEKRLISYEEIASNGEVMLKYAWKNALKYSNLWLPALLGFLTSYFTWLMVYLDSSIPGVQPPSPFSPNKYKHISGHSFHLNYVFAILIGFLVAFYTYWKEYSIEY